MEDQRIEILGQKLAYPTTVYGTTAVLFLCIALVIIAKIAADWASPEALAEARALLADETAKSSEISSVNAELLSQIATLQTKLLQQSSTSSVSSNAAEAPEDIEQHLERLRVRREQAYTTLLENQKARAKTASTISAQSGAQPDIRIYTGQQQQQQQQFEKQLEQIQQQQRIQ